MNNNNNRKPYVPHKGIKRNSIATTTPWGNCTITDWTPQKVQGHRVVGTDLKVNEKPVYIDLDKNPEIEAQINAANETFEAEFVAHYPGIYELVAAINDAEYRYERLQCEIERGDGILSNSTPEVDPEDVAKMYPIAAAYLTIIGYTDSDNGGKYSAGMWAIEQLEAGEDVIATHDAMCQRWHVYTSDHIWD